MRLSVIGVLAAAASLPAAVVASVARPRLQPRTNNATAVNGIAHVMNAEPELPHDADATPYCSWWLDNYGSEVCEEIPDWWGISMDDFVRWVSRVNRENEKRKRKKGAEKAMLTIWKILQNPSIKNDCSGFESGKSYCVEAVGEPPVTTTTQLPITSPPTSTLTTTTATSTKSGNGIET